MFCGHVHEPVLYTVGSAARPVAFRPVSGVAIPVPSHRRWLAVVGSAGQPRDGNSKACYVVLEDDMVRFRRVEYPLEKTIAKIYEIPELDNFLGDRLRDGR